MFSELLKPYEIKQKKPTPLASSSKRYSRGKRGGYDESDTSSVFNEGGGIPTSNDHKIKIK